jgi:hypothetical protein
MGSRGKDFMEGRDRTSLGSMPGKSPDSRDDAGFGAAYRKARANVLEASLSGLVRLRVI